MGIQYILAYGRCVVQTLVLSMSHSKGTGLTKQGAPGAIYILGVPAHSSYIPSFSMSCAYESDAQSDLDSPPAFYSSSQGRFGDILNRFGSMNGFSGCESKRRDPSFELLTAAHFIYPHPSQQDWDEPLDDPGLWWRP